MEIAPLPPSRYDDAVALWHATGLTRPWNDPAEDLRRAAGRGASDVLAAIRDGVLLATAMIGHDGHRGWLYYLAVAPAEQRSGLGRRMVRACEQWLQEREVPKIQLMVRADNRDVLPFYERLGYTDAGVVVLGRRLEA